mgnify:CR=1 FL=1
MSMDQTFAAVGLAAVLVTWVGLLLGAERRRRMLQRPLQWWRLLRAQGTAKREAADAIERAKRRPAATREGNVIRPRSFQRRADDDHTLH